MTWLRKTLARWLLWKEIRVLGSIKKDALTRNNQQFTPHQRAYWLGTAEGVAQALAMLGVKEKQEEIEEDGPVILPMRPVSK